MTRPFLLLLKGHPASGKSSLAHALARSLHWALLDKDDVKDHLYTYEHGNSLAYAVLWQIAARQLDLGLSIVVDSPLSYQQEYTAGCELAETHQAHLLIVETTLPEAVWRARLDTRSRAASAHKITGWDAMQQQLTQYQDCWRYPILPYHHLVVDTTRPLDLLVAEVQRRITAIQSGPAAAQPEPVPAEATHTNCDTRV